MQAWLESVGWNALSTSWVVIGEMRRGANLVCRRDTGQAQALDAWIDCTVSRLAGRIHPVDRPVADIWARLGIPDPIPTIDGLIAATALAHGLRLATRNVANFRIPGLSVIDPWAFVG